MGDLVAHADTVADIAGLAAGGAGILQAGGKALLRQAPKALGRAAVRKGMHEGAVLGEKALAQGARRGARGGGKQATLDAGETLGEKAMARAAAQTGAVRGEKAAARAGEQAAGRGLTRRGQVSGPSAPKVHFSANTAREALAPHIETVHVPGMTFGKGIAEQGMPFEHFISTRMVPEARLPQNFKTFDFGMPPVATSVKTLDTTTAARIAHPKQVYKTIKSHITDVSPNPPGAQPVHVRTLFF